MSFTLTSQSCTLEIARGNWVAVLDLARTYGWEPAGTTLPGPKNEGWRGDYDTNDGALVDQADAAAMAARLEQAEQAEQAGEFGQYDGDRQRWRELLRLLRDGGFRID